MKFESVSLFFRSNSLILRKRFGRWRKVSGLGLFFLLSATSNSYGNAENFCKVVGPGEVDRIGRTCESSFGVTYNGYLFAWNPCNSFHFSEAIVKSEPFCRKADRIGRYAILYPAQKDRTGRGCPSSDFGYMKDRLLVICYPGISDALSKMYDDHRWDEQE